MKTRLFGRTGCQVSELGLGTCFMSGQGQDGVSRCVAQAVDRGVNYFDTAADYGKGRDEEMLGLALQACRPRAFLATKVGCTPDPADHRRADGLMRQFEGSLRRLRTGAVDLIQLHEADQRKWWTDAPISAEEGMDHCGRLIDDEEDYDFGSAPAMEFLRRAKREGKARFVGVTGKDARRLARILGRVDVDGMMIAHQLNPVYRNAHHFLLPLTERRGIGVASGALLMKGWLDAAERVALESAAMDGPGAPPRLLRLRGPSGGVGDPLGRANAAVVPDQGRPLPAVPLSPAPSSPCSTEADEAGPRRCGATGGTPVPALGH